MFAHALYFEVGRQKRGDVGADRFMDCRVAHDAFLDVAALRLELRLDQTPY